MKMEQIFLSVSQFFIPLPFGSQGVTGFLFAHLLPPRSLAADHTGDNSCLDVQVQHKNLVPATGHTLVGSLLLLEATSRWG